MQEVLLPCPFCGGEGFISEDDYGMARWVSCEACETDGPPIVYRFQGTKEEARKTVIDRWNTRSNLDAISGA